MHICSLWFKLGFKVLEWQTQMIQQTFGWFGPSAATSTIQVALLSLGALMCPCLKIIRQCFSFFVSGDAVLVDGKLWNPTQAHRQINASEVHFCMNPWRMQPGRWRLLDYISVTHFVSKNPINTSVFEIEGPKRTWSWHFEGHYLVEQEYVGSTVSPDCIGDHDPDCDCWIPKKEVMPEDCVR